MAWGMSLPARKQQLVLICSGTQHFHSTGYRFRSKALQREAKLSLYRTASMVLSQRGSVRLLPFDRWFDAFDVRSSIRGPFPVHRIFCSTKPEHRDDEGQAIHCHFPLPPRLPALTVPGHGTGAPETTLLTTETQ